MAALSRALREPSRHARDLANRRWATSSAPRRDLGPGPARYAGALAFSPDGRLLAISVPDVGSTPIAGDVVIDPTTFKIRRTLHPVGDDDTVSLAFAPDGVLATGTEGGIVPAMEPNQRGTGCGARSRRRRANCQHRVRLDRPLAPRDHQQPGRNRKAVVLLDTPASRHGASHGSRRRVQRRGSTRATAACSSSTTTEPLSPGPHHWPPGNNARAPSPDAT